MTKTILLGLLLTATTILSACGATIDPNAKAAADDGNAHLDGFQNDAVKLLIDYHIVVRADGKPTEHEVPRELSPQQINEAKALLISLIGHGQAAVADSNRPGVVDTGHKIPQIQNSVNDANLWIEAINTKQTDVGEANVHLGAYHNAIYKLLRDYGIIVGIDWATSEREVPADLTPKKIRQAKALLISVIDHGYAAILESKRGVVVDQSHIVEQVKTGVADAKHWLSAVNKKLDQA